MDTGGGYTYLNEKAGFEFSAVFGLTYNFINPYTRYRNGNDAHLDWALSPYVSETMHIGAVGYFYNQLTAGDSGASVALGEFKSRVAAIGPLVDFFPFGDRQGYLNLRAYYEFAAQNRLEGWNAFVTLSIEPPEQQKLQISGNKALVSPHWCLYLYPPSAIATVTSAAPTATMARPVNHGRSPVHWAKE